MKRLFTILITLVMILGITDCGNKNQQVQTDSLSSDGNQQTEISGSDTDQGGQEVRLASDDAQMQKDNPEMPTRVLENGTKINMHFGDTVISGILNDSDTAKALIEKLPYTVHMSSYTHDYCGVMPEELPYNEDELHYGWLNGDIDYAIDTPYYTILHSDEESSEQYGPRVNIGVLTCKLDKIRSISGDYDVLIELAEDGIDSASTVEVEDTDMKMIVKVGDRSFTATLEDNAATHELIEMMKEAPVSIAMKDYSGFEKVGSLGRSLTTDDHQTKTSAGDIVLYSGNQIVMFYGSNSWSYTRIGKIDDLSGWKDALGKGGITAEFFLAE